MGPSPVGHRFRRGRAPGLVLGTTTNKALPPEEVHALGRLVLSPVPPSSGVWSSLVRPHASITDPHRRRVLALVASWNLVTIPLGPFLALMQLLAGEGHRISATWLVAAPVATLLHYGFARSRHAWPALWLQVISMLLLVAAAMEASPDRASTSLALVLPVLAAALCFRLRSVLAVQVMALVVLVLHDIQQPWENRGLLIGSAVVLLAAFAITAASVRLRELLLLDRTQIAKAEMERARVLLDAGFDGTAEVANGRLENVSSGFARALGSRPADLEGKDVDTAPALLRLDGPRREEAVPFIDSEGSLRYVSVLRQDLPRETGTYVLLAVRDQTHDQLRKSNLLFMDRMVAVGTLASGVAHEINNALMSLAGQSELGLLALNRNDTARARRSLAAVEDASERIAACVQQLRRFGTQRDQSKGWVDLNDVTASTLQLAEHRIRHVAKVEMNLAQDLSACRGDDSSVGQILMNLLLNAVDAVEDQDNASVTVTTKHEDAWACLVVADNGPGVSEEHRERIFQPFFTSKDQKGSGLGLSISASLAARMGGSLRLAPRTDTGAAFCLRLPVIEENPEATEEQPALFAPDPSLRVLLVDDEPDVLDVVRELLAPMRVVAVQSAQAAREAWEQDFDLILSDIVMPTESGLELRQWVAEHHPSALPRFVLMTGSAVGLEDDLARLGSDQPVLAKPLKKERILDLLARVSRTSDP